LPCSQEVFEAALWQDSLIIEAGVARPLRLNMPLCSGNRPIGEQSVKEKVLSPALCPIF
jgi:hypothetical protein